MFCGNPLFIKWKCQHTQKENSYPFLEKPLDDLNVTPCFGFRDSSVIDPFILEGISAERCQKDSVAGERYAALLNTICSTYLN